jgi:cyclopropane-fatty-acyl-phospholipid synthase
MASSAERLFYVLLDGIQEGSLIVRDPDGRERTVGAAETTPHVRVSIHHRDLYGRLLRDSGLGLGESYVDGWWDMDSGRIVDLLALVHRNDITSRVRGDLRLKGRVLARHGRTLPTRARSRRNAQFHYDLGNEFFRLFLDESMTYSCAYQRQPDDTLHQMQMQKYDLICRKLDLQPDDRLIDLGCGWGAMLVYAAKNYGIQGLGVTLSTQQQAWARRWIAEEGLSRRLEVRLLDYRQITGTYDKLVSIGMFEHVGKRYFPAFMAKAHELLKPGGIGLLHTMGTAGSRYPGAWLSTHIFPGTCLPRLEDLAQQMRRADLVVGHIENWKLHYAETARHWHDNFHANRKRILALGGRYDERFLRAWTYYLQLLEAGFRHDVLQLYQVLFCQGYEWTLPLTFDFSAREAAGIG